MHINKVAINGLATLILVAGCYTAFFGDSAELKNSKKKYIQEHGFAIKEHGLLGISGLEMGVPLVKMSGASKVYIFTKGGENLREFSERFYKDPNSWFDIRMENPAELNNRHPDESLPGGLKIPAWMDKWQVEAYKKTFPGTKMISEENK